ncbi:MAG: Crp/Fnr family transcriptional regulator [Gammaproteobacteria bacterium]|nr:Crp/Fnr family transcriptional regulator [Gammaproteobacteria bacterium]
MTFLNARIVLNRECNVLTTVPVNRLIEALPHKERNKLLQECEPVELEFGMVLCEEDRLIQYVYFPTTSIISLVTTLSDHPPLQMGMIGNEGMLGGTLALGINVASMRALVQGNGTALRMNAEQLRHELRENAALLQILNRYIYVLMAQLSKTVACTHFHEIEPRLAHLLLMTHDRAPADHFHLTHEFLANMLGVRRSGITVAAGILQKHKLINYKRGEIRILNRKGLEAVACECYKDAIEDYEQILGENVKF